ncbi:co-chaperone GroES [Candidatus Desantisbacteria bacterium]|nr:co-chaperone GroES [Candidatus Desantisbacteria bacterium]
MTIKPMFDKVLIKPLEAKEQIKGGIIIPDTAKEKPQEGEVKAIGSGKVLENGQKQAFVVKVGDKVLFGKYSGSEVKLDDVDYLIMREEDILGIIS